MDEIVDTEFLEFENDRREIASQDLGISLFFELCVRDDTVNCRLDSRSIIETSDSPP